MAFQLEKLIKEHKDKLKPTRIEARSRRPSSKVREAAKGEDADAIKSAIGELEQASHALSKTLYEAGTAQAGAGAGGPSAGPAAPATGKPGEDEASTPSSK